MGNRKATPLFNHNKKILLMSTEACPICGRRINLEIHHIIPLAQGGSDAIDNLQVLCDACHDAVHGHNRRVNQRIGIDKAKAQGKYKGGQVKKIDEELFMKTFEDYIRRKITKSTMAKTLSISRPTLDKILKDKGLMAK